MTVLSSKGRSGVGVGAGVSSRGMSGKSGSKNMSKSRSRVDFHLHHVASVALEHVIEKKLGANNKSVLYLLTKPGLDPITV